MKKCILILCCSIISAIVGAQPITTLRIDPLYGRGGTVSQIFDSIQFIPLETTKESTFGAIQNLQVSRHYFVFYDYSTKGIFVFDKEGKFKGKITTAPGLDKNSYYLLSDFVVNPYSENIYLPYYNIHHIEPRIAIFKPDGAMLKVISLDTAVFNGIQSSTFSFIDSNTALFARDTRGDTGRSYFAVVKNFKTVVADVLPLRENDPFKSYLKNYNLASVSTEGSLWRRQSDYNFYKVNDSALAEGYRFVFPASMTLDSSFYKDSALLVDYNLLEKYNRAHLKTITNIQNLHMHKKLLFFTLVKGYYSVAEDNLLYSLATGSLYRAGKLSPDSLSCFLPVMDIMGIQAADDQYMYTQMPSYEMFNVKEATKDKHPDYTPVLQNYFATQDRKSNPVIVQLKPKENL